MSKQKKGKTPPATKKPKTEVQQIDKSWWLSILLLLLLSYLVYIPAQQNSLTGWDDKNYIIENKDIHQLDKNFIQKSFSIPSGYVMGNYHPLTMISYAIEYKYAQLNPKVYHRTNVILHLINGLLVFLFIWLLCGKLMVSFISAALFLLHPMHVESVAWVAERKDLLYAMFGLGALCSYLHYIKKNNSSFYLLCLILFVLAVLSKGMAIAMVALLPLLDFYSGRQLLHIRTLLEKIPFVAIGIIFGIIAINAQKAAEAIDTSVFPLADRFLFAGYSFITYLWKAFIPVNLSAFYDYPPKGTYSWYILYIVLALAIAFLAFISARKTKKILFGFLFFTFSVVLILQVLPVGGAILAERYTYIAYIGIFYLLGEGVQFLWENRQTASFKPYAIPAMVTTACFILWMMPLTRERINIWKDTLSIWNDVLTRNPTVIKAYNGRGDAYNENHQYAEAVADFTKALEMKFDYPDAYYNRGLAYYFIGKKQEEQRNNAEALRYYRLAIIDNSKAIQYKPNLSRAYFNRSGNYFTIHRYDSALTDAMKAKELGMEVDPAYIQMLEKEVSNLK